ncbi:MAG: hypothetical protein A3F10_00075 [Coxiella sp. RIFCSPHIGHO2_12_FULL_42_15]|nr:MAG: hypothetical protein A3F10_00075 [Coxiella sp. RIFCSPHIGHO2_12_FULL_42_15]
MERLIKGAQAHYFVLPTFPDISATPRFNQADASEKESLKRMIDQHNQQLQEKLAPLVRDYGIVLIPTNLQGILEDLSKNPTHYQIENTNTACYTGGSTIFESAGTICEDPEHTLFWDDIHPSATAHCIIGRRAFSDVSQRIGHYSITPDFSGCHTSFR